MHAHQDNRCSEQGELSVPDVVMAPSMPESHLNKSFVTDNYQLPASSILSLSHPSSSPPSMGTSIIGHLPPVPPRGQHTLTPSQPSITPPSLPGPPILNPSHHPPKPETDEARDVFHACCSLPAYLPKQDITGTGTGYINVRDAKPPPPPS